MVRQVVSAGRVWSIRYVWPVGRQEGRSGSGRAARGYGVTAGTRVRRRRRGVRRSPPSRFITTTTNTAVTAALTRTETPTLGKNPWTRSRTEIADPAAAPAAQPASPARNARDTPASAAAPRSRRTSTSSATPATVSPTELPPPSAGTTHGRGTNGTISRSATITSSQPALIATAGALFLPRAYRTRERLADSPYPTSPGAKAASVPARTDADAAECDSKTRASGSRAPASAAAPSQDASMTARVDAAAVASRRSEPPAKTAPEPAPASRETSEAADSSGKVLVAIGTASTA